MLQVPGRPPMWISSITRLPNFYRPSDLICGEFSAFTSELYEPIQMLVRQGRNIQILDGMTKYKLEFQSQEGIASMVCLSLQPFDPSQIQNPVYDTIPVFPLFIHYGRSCLLFIEAINDLFTSTPIVVTMDPSVGKTVCSPMGFIKRIDGFQMHSALSAEYDTRYSHIGRPDQIMELYSETQLRYSDNRDIRNSLDSKYGIEFGQIPLDVQMLGNIRCVAHMRQFLNPYGSMPSDVAMMCSSIAYESESVKDVLREHGCLPMRSADVYQDAAEDFSLVGKLLTAIYEQPMESFEIPVRIDDKDVHDLYAMRCNVHSNFKHSFERITDWSMLNTCLMSAFNLESLSGEIAAGTNELKAQRTWLEDLVIKDQNDNILQYIDMTWWILACADGIINDSILDSVTYI